MKVIYLDNNATTRVDPMVVDAMQPYFSELYGNPSSMHSFGGQVAQKLQLAREQTAALLGADPSEIIFTSCGTESDNAAIKGTLASYPEKKHVIISRVEHPAVLNQAKYLTKAGYKVTELGVDREGRLNLEQLKKSLTDDTAMVSLMWANNETGVVFPVEEIAELVKSRGAVFHTDAVQAAGKIPINLKKSQIDFLSLSGHKLHAPKGIGVLYKRKGARFTPFMVGGHQERGLRSGTENVPYIIGLGVACRLAVDRMEDENTRVKALRDKLEKGLVSTVPNVFINGGGAPRLPNTLSISFEFIEGESILLMLDKLGICASSGSACTSGSLEPSHVLRAMGVPFTAAHGSIRFSLSYYNNEEEIDFVLAEVPAIIQKLRAISPFWKPETSRPAAACS
ncbi:MAG: cysteine desulfurase NifS [Deltaproteobacteria bacterium]|nr:cysteine desulfurase NifS [Deltaproteobacteria bacterium]